MFDKALVIGIMTAGMLSGCASFGDLQQHHQVERILQQKEEPVGIVFPIRLDFDEADNMTTLSVQKELIETLESDDQVTVVGFELGQILCDTVDEAEDASTLIFATSPTETLKAVRVSYKVFSGEAFSDGVTRKVWMGKGTEKDADGTYRTVSLSWTTECNAETFLQTVTTHGPNGTLSVVKSIPCGTGSSIDICIVEIDLDLNEPGEPLMLVDTSKNNTEDSDNTRRHLGVQNLREGGKKSAKIAGDGRSLQSSTPRIDVLIVYNEVALEELGNISTSQMETILVAEVEESNDILANSEIDLEFVLVHTEEWHYELETDKGASILSILRANDSVSNLRSEYQADLVALIAPLSKACGTGYLYAGVFHLGYTVTDPNCLAGRTLTHEFGHNLGCLHDRNSSAWQHYYAHGLRYCTGNPMIHTIMAYRCGGVDIQYFSNPEVSYSGLPTGIANDADCARRIRETMMSVSEYSDASMCNDNGGLATSLGDGWCDSDNNNEACLWDRGDCCKSCCTHALCGSNGYDCQDPVGYGDCVITDEPTPAPITEAAPTGSSPPQTTPAPITEVAPTGSSPPQTIPAPITEAAPTGSSPPQTTPAPINRASRSTSAPIEAALLLSSLLLSLLSFSQL